MSSDAPRVLLLKTSSMGDVIHCLPALTDAREAMPGIQFDWVVEEAFACIPGFHPAVREVIEVAIRRWRRHPVDTWRTRAWAGFRNRVRQGRYDLILDAQGLLKSALLTRLNAAPSAGYDRNSIREPLASGFYDRRYAVDKERHAVERIRTLFAKALDYPVPENPGHYGLDRSRIPRTLVPDTDYLVFCHGTTWRTKLWPLHYWQELAKKAATEGLSLFLPWGNEEEKVRAQRIAGKLPGAHVCNRASLAELAGLIGHARGVVSVDTGLGHLAAALAVPAVSLYGPTRPGLTGNYGLHQTILASRLDCAPCMSRKCLITDGPSATYPVFPPCFEELSPDQVWQALKRTMQAEKESISP